MTIQSQVEEKLKSKFCPVYQEVTNESYMHNVPEGAESHFKVVLVSEEFSSLSKVRRHQAVYKVLAEEMDGPIHALALHTYSPVEWEVSEAPESPNCMGGSKAD